MFSVERDGKGEGEISNKERKQRLDSSFLKMDEREVEIWCPYVVTALQNVIVLFSRSVSFSSRDLLSRCPPLLDATRMGISRSGYRLLHPTHIVQCTRRSLSSPLPHFL